MDSAIDSLPMQRWLRAIALLLPALSAVFLTPPAIAGPLSDRLAAFPQWSAKPAELERAMVGEDLVYPDWMVGTWQVTSTLVDLAAPLAPEIVTPGFEQNRNSLQAPVEFQVRFGAQRPPSRFGLPQFWPRQKALPVVADRAFNGDRIARAYLGNEAVRAVKVDPENPNRQLTVLDGDRQLIATVSDRASETPDTSEFVACELTQQVFQTPSQIYLNEVEVTTAYRYDSSDSSIRADQVTAIYLSPQDPQYFQASGRPVALYRYALRLDPLLPQALD